MKRRVLTIAAPFSVMLAAPLAALAAGDEGGGAAELGWQAFNLVVILSVLVYLARKPIKEFFAHRRVRITGDLEAAADLLGEAERRNAQLQRRLAELDGEVREITDTAKRRAEEEGERILADARRSAERIRQDASAAVEQELERARRELRSEAADLAVRLATEILQEQVSDNDRDRLLDEFITRVEPSGEAAS